MIRILHVVGQMNRGGAEVLIMNLFRHLERDKITFDFAVNRAEPGHFDAEIVALGGRIFHHPDPAKAGFREFGQHFSRTLYREGPFTAVHSHVYHFSGYVLHLAAQAGIRQRIAHSHNVDDGHLRSFRRRGYRWLMRRLIKHNATHMLGCSRAACSALFGTSSFNDERVAVFKNAIDLDRFAHLNPNLVAVRNQLGFPQTFPLIGHVGSFTVQKNHPHLLEIFKAVLAQEPDAHLVLVGDGPLRPKIQAMVNDMGLAESVSFLGVRSDVPIILGALDLFLFPSLYEGLPIVAIEAQSAGVPVLGTDAISDEADLGLGLVKRLSSAEPLNVWLDLALEQLQLARTPWSVRRKALCHTEYDIRNAAQSLQELYLNGA